jgi:outer membrane protein insertion porin family
MPNLRHTDCRRAWRRCSLGSGRGARLVRFGWLAVFASWVLAPVPATAQPAPPAPDTWGTTDPPPSRDPDPTADPAPVEAAPEAATDVADDNHGPRAGDRGDAGPSADMATTGCPACADAAEAPLPSEGGVRYTLEGIEIRGNRRTRPRVVLRYVPFEIGDIIDVDDPEVELTRYRLLVTGFFRDVQFSLRRGSRRGQVILVIEVVERNTVVVNDLWMGLSSDRDPEGHKRPLTAYTGLDVAETNLAGTGITLGSAVGLAQDQLALRVRFLDPAFVGTEWMLSAELLFNDAQDFFGNAHVRYQAPEVATVQDFAVLPYERFGGNVGVGRDLSIATQLWLHYRLEGVHATVPLAASHDRNGFQPIEPIRFDIQPGDSVLSSTRATLQYDSRDHPFLPQRGWFTQIHGELGLAALGSDYGYQRIEARASRWWRLPWKHVVRLELFGGAITGNAPFFEQYYVGDFSDFLASRALGLNFDRRPPNNFLGTAIAEVRRGHYAAKLGGEYRIGLYRGKNSVYGIDFFTSAGIFSLASQNDILHPPANYSGAASVPIDVTANLGFRMDTAGGGLTFAFSNILGFIPAR